MYKHVVNFVLLIKNFFPSKKNTKEVVDFRASTVA